MSKLPTHEEKCRVPPDRTDMSFDLSKQRVPTQLSIFESGTKFVIICCETLFDYLSCVCVFLLTLSSYFHYITRIFMFGCK